MSDVKDKYVVMFATYPDVVDLEQMRTMLGGARPISPTLAYRMLKKKQIKSKKIGREYKILKTEIINYLTD
jgi:hypothetical protein